MSVLCNCLACKRSVYSDHVEENLGADKKVRLAISQENFVWQANSTTSVEEFERALDGLNKFNSEAEKYLLCIPVEKWILHPHHEFTPLFGWRTTNFVESEQARSLKLKPRMMLPFEFFKAIFKILMGERRTRQQLCEEWARQGHLVTSRAEKKLTQLKLAAEYIAVFSSDLIAFVVHVTSPMTQRRINIEAPYCSCET